MATEYIGQSCCLNTVSKQIELVLGKQVLAQRKPCSFGLLELCTLTDCVCVYAVGAATSP